MSASCGRPRFFPVLFPLLMLIIVQLVLVAVAPVGGSLVDVELQELRIGQKNVCPNEEVEIVTIKEPCVQAYTKYVRTRKPNCGGRLRSCTVREPKTVYYRTYKEVNRTRRHVTSQCCHGWIHVPGEQGCQRPNCTTDLCYNGGSCSTSSDQLCDCVEGFQGSRCQYDINECLVANGGCHHDCCNTIGTFYCRCWPGYELDTDGRRCTDVNECRRENGGCEYRCVNSDGGFRCECPPDKQLHSDGRRCVDSNSCDADNGGCAHLCEELNGRFYRCKCRPGYLLADDKRSCQRMLFISFSSPAHPSRPSFAVTPAIALTNHGPPVGRRRVNCYCCRTPLGRIMQMNNE
uniref:Uncharacterized protein n=1 Tax=Plectus sambesii TaxID=2011161 RepID=A0A914W1B2_9BILA